jgi:hypothetical protein
MASAVRFGGTETIEMKKIRHNDDGRLQDHERLRSAGPDGVDSLYALACRPPVFRYLFDGAAPARAFMGLRIAQSVGRPAVSGLGMCILEVQAGAYAGRVELRPYAAPGSAELTCLFWGLATGNGDWPSALPGPQS